MYILDAINLNITKQERLLIKGRSGSGKSSLVKIISGIITGFVSAPMGIGGAVMNVPILKFFGYTINKAI